MLDVQALFLTSVEKVGVIRAQMRRGVELVRGHVKLLHHLLHELLPLAPRLEPAVLPRIRECQDRAGGIGTVQIVRGLGEIVRRTQK